MTAACCSAPSRAALHRLILAAEARRLRLCSRLAAVAAQMAWMQSEALANRPNGPEPSAMTRPCGVRGVSGWLFGGSTLQRHAVVSCIARVPDRGVEVQPVELLQAGSLNIKESFRVGV